MKASILIMVICFSISAIAADEKKVIYEYKKYEKFDFDDLAVEGDEVPGDLSILPRKEKEYANKIPDKKNFNREMLNSLESLK